MNRMKGYASIGAAVAAVVAGSYFGAAANAQSSTQTPTPRANAQSGPQPTRITGKVSSVGANSLTLTTGKGDITANIGPNTWIVVRKDGANSQGSISDIVKDKVAFVAGMTTADPKVVDARVVTEGAGFDKATQRNGRGKSQGKSEGKKGLADHVGSGTVKSVNGSTLTITTAKGKDVAVATTAGTVVLNNGFQAVSSIKAGDKVQVLGTRQPKDKNAPVAAGNPQVTAWALRVQNTGTQLSRGSISGPVNGNTFTLKTARNPGGVTVNVTGATAYRSLTVSVADRTASLGNAAQADLKADSKVIVDGTLSADGKTLTATAVIILPSKASLKTQPKP